MCHVCMSECCACVCVCLCVYKCCVCMCVLCEIHSFLGWTIRHVHVQVG